ncbi:hypothetical protein K461DRAFT_297097 [Myriangium duriaei CBS 260.36]|uniref:Uncharacterized protein n=1 Tax=Myriangium duriaei CBS 260.36 TaxID=1168546 RepID=A0A9P4ITC8_9PEZI|nr:hypothetical protein K461DRAFT_297097 [Myriangium duriaei CBS 260.36]
MSQPNNNGTIVGWVTDPKGRGTSEIFSSCAATLTICVWTALHLNIPGHTDSTKKGWARRALWMTIGIVSSELVLLSAWRQYSAVHVLTKDMKTLKKQGRKSPDKDETIADWSITHSFYAVMGGFAFQLTEGQRKSLGLIQSRYTLTPSGVLLLAKCGLLRCSTRAELKDRSKSDALAKTLVLMQTIWFLIQCLVRTTQSLPLSLLEFHTIAHVVCACVIFGLWWHKLGDIQYPTFLSGEWVPGMCAYMLMSSRVAGKSSSSAFQDHQDSQPELVNFRWNCSSQRLEPTDPSLQRPTETRYMFSWVRKSLDLRALSGRPDKKPHQPGSTKYDDDTQAPCLGDRVNARLAAAQAAIEEHEALARRFYLTEKARGGAEGFNLRTPRLEQLLVPFMSDWPDDSLVGRPQGQIIGMIMWFASIINGGIHLCAWKSHFPSKTERLLWQAASGYITASGLL